MFCQLFRELIKIHKSAEVLSFSLAATRKFRVLPAPESLLGPVGPALIILVMMLALLTVHLPHGFFAQSNGIELPVTYITGALAVASRMCPLPMDRRSQMLCERIES